MAVDLYGPSEGLDPTKPVAGLDLYAPDPNEPGALKRGFGVGVAGLKSAVAGAKALGARVVGTPEAEKAALADVAAQNEIAAQNAISLESVKLTDPVEVIKYFGYLVAQAAPTLLTMAGGGLIGRGLGALAGRAAASTAAGAATAKKAGTYLGAVAPDVAIETGSIFPEALETKVENPIARSLAGGAAAASLDFLPLLAIERYFKAAGRGGFGAVAKGAAKGAPVGAALEGAQEVGQSAIERLSPALPPSPPQTKTH